MPWNGTHARYPGLLPPYPITTLPHIPCYPAGWDLLQSLLAPRHIQVDDNGAVAFVNDSPFPRISAYEALKHK